MRLLIVEDNPKAAEFVKQGLSELGYVADVVEGGFEAEERATTSDYDVIVLDLMLPDEDGIQVCRNLRRRGVATPILMLTALSATQDKVAALNAGADDYLTKPFDFDELVARVRALMRRAQPTEAATLTYADVKLDLVAHRLSRGDQTIRLTNKEFALLEYLLRNPHRVISRGSISEHVWDTRFSPDSNVIDVYIGLLRRKLDQEFSVKLIHTVIGRGYYFGSTPPEM